MSTFDDDIHTHDSRLLGMYVGYVTKRDDEEQLGACASASGRARARERVGVAAGDERRRLEGPGLLRGARGGRRGRGLLQPGQRRRAVLPRGALGKPNGESEVPEEAQKNPPDNRVLATQTFRVELDERRAAGGSSGSPTRRPATTSSSTPRRTP